MATVRARPRRSELAVEQIVDADLHEACKSKREARGDRVVLGDMSNGALV